MSGEKISVDSDKVTINDYEITDEDVVKHFDSLKEQGKNLDDELDKLLKLGAIAAKATTVGISTDYVDKCVNDFKNNFQYIFEILGFEIAVQHSIHSVARFGCHGRTLVSIFSIVL